MPGRLAEAVAARTGLPADEVRLKAISLSLPVGDIETRLEGAYGFAVQAARIQAAMVARLQELREAGRELDDPSAEAEVGAFVERLEEARAGAGEFDGERSLLQAELKRRAEVDLSRLKLWDIARLADGIFILAYRERDIDHPTGARSRDHLHLYLDTTPGREGALAYVHRLG